jgi:hypothetical protein
MDSSWHGPRVRCPTRGCRRLCQRTRLLPDDGTARVLFCEQAIPPESSVRIGELTTLMRCQLATGERLQNLASFAICWRPTQSPTSAPTSASGVDSPT